MLKVKTIRPLGSATAIPLDSIKKEYLRRVKQYYNPLAYINQSLINNQLTSRKGPILPTTLTADQRTLLEYIRINYDSLITAPPRRLQTHIMSIDNTQIGIDVNRPRFGTRFESSTFGKGLFELFGYEDYFRSVAHKGTWLAKQLNIKTCPYCNSQYTLIVEKDSSAKAKFQFDHFFSKRRYPYLSISLYNLIPSCAPCNLSKGDKKTDLTNFFHPYFNNLCFRATFKAEFPVELKKLSIADIKKLDIKIQYKSKHGIFDNMIQNHKELFDIEPSYSRHVDIVEDLLAKAIVNNSAFRKDVMKVKGLFNGNKSLYLRYLIGNYGLHEELNERPLVKLAQDIAKQFEII